MSRAEIQTTLDSFFKSRIADALPSVRVAYDNQEGTPKNTDVDGFARHSVLFDENRFAALGDTLLRQQGNVQIEMFIPKGKGKSKALVIDSLVEKEYTGVCADSVKFRASSNPFSGVIGDFYKYDILIDFYSDENK